MIYPFEPNQSTCGQVSKGSLQKAVEGYSYRRFEIICLRWNQRRDQEQGGQKRPWVY
jgi:hypothetical protein